MQHIHGATWDPPQGSDGMEEELTLLTLPLSIICQQSWLTREVPHDLRMQMQHPPSWMSGRRMWGTHTAWPWCQGKSWCKSLWVSPHTEQPGDQSQPARGDEWQVLLDQPDLLWRGDNVVGAGKAWMLSAWTSAKHLTPLPTASSWRNWLPIAWTGALFAGLKAGWMAEPREWWRMETHPVVATSGIS